MISTHAVQGSARLLVALAVVVALLPAMPARAAVQATLYASPSGTGSACSQASPCSLVQARTNVRGLTAGQTGDIVVLLRGGTYTFSTPFTLTDDGTTGDSGQNGHIVAYRNYPGEKPVFSGGTRVTGWSVHNSSRNIYRAPVGTLVSREVWVDGVRATRARTPLNPGGFTATTTGFTRADNWSGFGRPTDLEFVANIEYHHHRCHVSNIAWNGSTSAITLVQPCFDNTRFAFGFGQPVWVENAYEFLDSAGEFYLDTHSTPHYLYYIPRSGEALTGGSPAAVTAGSSETILSATGTASTPLHDIEISGVTFAHSTWTGPDSSDGYVTEGAGMRHIGAGAAVADDPRRLVKTPAAVKLSRVLRLRLHRNTFSHLGSTGLDIADASQHVTVQGNSFVDISGNGINVSGVAEADHHPTVASQRTYAIVIDNNLIDGVAAEFADGVGIFLGFSDTVTVSHNEIANLPYTGIWDGHGYGRMDVGGEYGYTTATTQKNHAITGNHVHDVMNVLKDGGAIYTENNSPSSTVSGNYVHNVRNIQAGFYLDEQSSHWAVTGNVARSVPYWWTLQYNSSGNTITGNWTDTASSNPLGGSASTNVITPNTVFTNASVPGAAQAVIDSAGLQAAYRDLLRPQTYSFDDISGTEVAVNGVHASIDFGSGKWKADNPSSGYGVSGYGYFAGEGTSRTFRIPAGTVLTSIRLAGVGSYSVSDGTRTLSGSLSGNTTAQLVTTGWTVAAPTITVTLSTGYNSVVDDITYAVPQTT